MIPVAKSGNYSTIFTEPEANNCLVIIAKVLSNSVVNIRLMLRLFCYTVLITHYRDKEPVFTSI